MANRPREGQFIYLYHDVAEEGSHAMKLWMEHENPAGMVSLKPGPPGSWSPVGIDARVKEYREILNRMKDRRFEQYPKHLFACQVQELYDERDDLGKRKNTQEDVAEKLTLKLKRNVDPVEVSRALRYLKDGGKDWISGSSQSLTDFHTKPPFISPIKDQSD